MAIVYRTERKNEYLYLVGEGVEDGLKENQQIHRMILDLCREHHCRRVLIDDRNVVYTASIISIFDLAKYYVEMGVPRCINRAAVVVNPVYEETNSFFETVVRNRGVNLRIFYDYEEAEVWLLEETGCTT